MDSLNRIWGPKDRDLEGLAKILWGSLGLGMVLLGLVVLGSDPTQEYLLDLYPRLVYRTVDGEPAYWVNRFGLELIYRGVILCLALIWFILRPRERPFTLGQKKKFLPFLAVVMLLVLWLPSILLEFNAVIGGERYWWLVDDMMITMRYAHNLASGVGLVWNPGEHVEGYTNFLWALYMALVHLLPIPLSKTALVVSLTNIALSVLIILLIIRLATLLKGGPFAVVATLVAYVGSSNFRTWSVAGTESVLLAMMVLAAIILILRDLDRESPSPLPYLLLGAMTLVRSDALILSALLYGTSFVLHREKARVVAFAGIWLFFPLAHLLFRFGYYGELVPNTAYLKVFNWEGRVSHGARYVFHFARNYALPMLLVLVAAFRGGSRAERLLGGSVLIYSGYIAYAGGDIFPQNRFFVPVLPLLFILAFVSLERLFVRRTLRLFVSVLTVATIPLVIPGEQWIVGPSSTSIGHIKIALLLKENLPPGGKAADFWAGIPFYFSGAYGVDLLGKNDPHIARLPAVYRDHPGHNKFDFDYSLGVLKPDVVISSFSLPVTEGEMRRLASQIPWRGRLYFNGTFRDHCLPNPINIETVRTIFVCDWSPELSSHEQWRAPF